MRRNLPPLKSLLAFEAASRHLSITTAADELCVTPAAISYHIKVLEDWLKTPLFRHERRTMALTDAGRAYTRALKTTLDELAVASDQVRSSNRKDQLTVTGTPAFVMKWLMPRLHRFRKAHPDIELVLSASASMTDFLHESSDVGIHSGPGGYPDMHETRLAQVEVFPVCRPKSLLNGLSPPRTLDDLARHTLLHDDMLRVNERKDWRFWLQSAGAQDLSIAQRGIHFNQAALAYEAAIEGNGIALAKSVLVSWDLHAKRLIRPFEHSCPTGFFYWLICRPSRADEPKIVAFRDWIVAEIKNPWPHREKY
jgi:LysR family glycine cleavage system transcriptional activator